MAAAQWHVVAGEPVFYAIAFIILYIVNAAAGALYWLMHI